jgi:hypothetical protein
MKAGKFAAVVFAIVIIISLIPEVVHGEVYHSKKWGISIDYNKGFWIVLPGQAPPVMLLLMAGDISKGKMLASCELSYEKEPSGIVIPIEEIHETLIREYQGDSFKEMLPYARVDKLDKIFLDGHPVLKAQISSNLTADNSLNIIGKGFKSKFIIYSTLHHDMRFYLNCSYEDRLKLISDFLLRKKIFKLMDSVRFKI